jgi:hypothetical protein
MKRNFVFTLLAGSLALTMGACNNSSETTTAADTTGTNDTIVTTTNVTTSSDYSAMADTIEANSRSGYYLNPRTGKPLRLKVDRTSGTITDETSGEPVWHYVDNRNWWVYGDDDNNNSWDTLGQAKMEGSRLMYQDDNDKWVDYDARWKSEDERKTKDWKTKVGDTKLKVGKDGDIKVKDENGKVKYDASKDKMKTDTSK